MVRLTTPCSRIVVHRLSPLVVTTLNHVTHDLVMIRVQRSGELRSSSCLNDLVTPTGDPFGTRKIDPLKDRVRGNTHEASNLSRMISEIGTPLFVASFASFWTTETGRVVVTRRVSPRGLIFLGRAITATLIQRCETMREPRDRYPIGKV